MTIQTCYVLCALYDKEATGIFSGITIHDIQEQEICGGLSYSVIYKILTDLFNLNYVRIGATIRNAYTYYLTDKGIEFYLNEIGGSE